MTLLCSGCSLARGNCHGGTASRAFISVVSPARAGARDMRMDNYGPPSHFFSIPTVGGRFVPWSEKFCIHKCKHLCSSNCVICMNSLM